MKLFIVNYWVPFPSSEYGGVQLVIANNTYECTAYLINASDNYYKEQYPNYRDLIKDKVDNASIFELTEYSETGIIEEFIT